MQIWPDAINIFPDLKLKDELNKLVFSGWWTDVERDQEGRHRFHRPSEAEPEKPSKTIPKQLATKPLFLKSQKNWNFESEGLQN